MKPAEEREYSSLFESFTKSATLEVGSGFEYIDDEEILSMYNEKGFVLLLREQKTVNVFIKLIDKLLLEDVINKNYTRSELIKAFILFFEGELAGKSAKDLISNLKNITNTTRFCLIPIYGINVNDSVTFEKITIVPGINIIEVITKEHGDIDKHTKKILNENSKMTFALLKIKSQSKKRASEIAEDILRRYLNVIRVFIGSKSRKSNVSVDDSIRFLSRSIVFDSEQITLHNRIVGSSHPIRLDDSFFTKSKYIAYLLKLEDVNMKRTDIQKRLFLGSQLLGESFLESNLPTRFLKAIMSVEAMIQTKGESTKDISFKGAYILEENSEDRQNIYKDFNKLYDLRSKIAHGESVKIGMFEEYLAMDYATNIMVNLIDKDFLSYTEFETFIFERKMS